MVRLARLSALTLLLALPCHVGAQASAESVRLDPVENHRRVTFLAQLLAGLGAELTASVFVVGAGFGAGVLATERDPEEESPPFIEGRGTLVLLATTTTAALTLLPVATAWAVHGVGARRGEPGSFRAAWLGSLAGGASAFTFTFLVAWPALSLKHDDAALGATAIASVMSFGGFLAGAMLGERHSRAPGVAEATRTRILPVFGMQAGRHVSFGLLGAF